MKIISFASGPGAGKSTTAAGLFFKMKMAGYKCELVPEYAKDLTFEGRHVTLSNQVYILGKQYNRVERLRNQVDWVITDSPIILGCMYAPVNYPESFTQLVIDLWNQNENHLFFVNRKKAYQAYGRSQTEDEAKEIDQKVKGFLNLKNINFHEIDGTPEAPDTIGKILGLNL